MANPADITYSFKSLVNQPFAHYLKVLLVTKNKSNQVLDGAKLFQQGKVMRISANPPKWQYAVTKSTSKNKGHGVVLDQLGTANPRISCTCRRGFDNKSNCVHIAAALLHLLYEQLSAKRLNLNKIAVLHASQNPYFFEVPSNISQILDFHTPEELFFYHHDDDLIVLPHVMSLPLQAKVWTEHDTGISAKNLVTFDVEQNWVFTTCDCKEQVLRLCEHQTRVLGQIMRYDDGFFQAYWKSPNPDANKARKPKRQKPVAFQDHERKKGLYLSELDGFIMFKPVVQYGEHDADPMMPEETIWIDKERGQIVERNPPFEKEFVAWLVSLHPDFEKQKHGSVFFLSPQKMLSDEWFFTFLDQLEEAQVTVYGQKDLQSFKYAFSKPDTTFSIKSGIDWFDAKIEVEFNGEVIPLEKIKKALINKQNYVVLSDGRLGILPEKWLKKLERYFRLGQTQKGEKSQELRIAKQHFSVLDEMLGDVDDKSLQQEIADRKKALKAFTQIDKVQQPSNIEATLRPYQLEGFNWLNFLRKYRFGGILADDMGLGKTLQTITMLAQMLHENHTGTHLVVGPTSLLHNWQSEIMKFCPNLTWLVHHGSSRTKQIDDLAEFDVIITTYGTLVNDVEWLKTMRFSWLVLDESQAIKNLHSQRNKALRLIEADHKLALSGTPVENNTFELFAQMQVVNPAFLGTADHFRREYAKPIDQEGDQEKAAELRKIIKPFILRRTKSQVAKDLPEKTETVLYCDMGSEQRTIYEQFKEDVRNELMGQIEAKGIEKSQMHVLTSLLKMRQLCLSTGIVKLDKTYEESYSTKLDVLKEQLHNLPEGSKALVFSQFVKMLNEVQKMLDEDGTPYAYLDGKTKDRQAEVKRFQEDPDCKVFVISLKAGGTGLNLTAADYVYILDPWWNPAVEAQAIDRCYRIGQKKQVFAYKMICENSIEEKILKLQEKKLAVAQGVVQSDDSVFKQLTKDDLEELFA